MGIDDLVDGTVTFLSDHTLWAVLVVLAMVAFVYWKPKDMFKLAMAGLTLGALIYICSFIIDLTSQGIDESRKFTNTPRVQVE